MPVMTQKTPNRMAMKLSCFEMLARVLSEICFQAMELASRCWPINYLLAICALSSSRETTYMSQANPKESGAS